ncbi:MAG: hypothetical protein MJ244_05435 [Clostridia bacterium]|nr:hypothetical protein [Clostridia bacterium]
MKELESTLLNLRYTSKIVKENNELFDARKSIEKDPVFKRLYEITVRQYQDEGLDPNDITFSQIIELDFDYFARTYGAKFFIVKRKDKKIEYFDI